MKRFRLNLLIVTRALEILIGMVTVIAIGISMISVYDGFKILIMNPTKADAFLDFLAIVFDLLIGVEFLKMIFKYSVGTVIEVLLFAIARQLIVEHTNAYENCVGVISIVLLFVIRKYLYVPDLDKIDKDK